MSQFTEPKHFAQDFGLIIVAAVWVLITLGIVAVAWLVGRGSEALRRARLPS